MVFSRLFGKRAPEFPRETVFDGLFFPADAGELRALVNQHLLLHGPGARAIVVPHSDLRFVGPLYGGAYGELAARRKSRAVVVGPSHKVPFAGFAVPNADGWTTPLGTVAIDVDAWESLGETTSARVIDAAFAAEPAVELQIPWLQELDRELSVVPLLCGDVTADAALEVLDCLVDDESLLVVACEFSRDLPEPEVRRRDDSTLDAISGLDPGAIGRGDVTARTLLQALLRLAADRGWRAEIVDYKTSVDLGAPPGGAAGYGAIAFFESGNE